MGALGEAGPDTAAVRNRLLETLGVPADRRGIVLLCGYVAAAIFGLFALITPPGDPIGWAYIALAIIGYWFIRTRGLTTFLWLLVAFGGAAVGSAGGLSGWLEFALGVALALVGLSPLRRRSAAAVTVGTAFVATPLPNGDSPDPAQDSSAELSELESTQPEALPVPSTRLFIRALGALRLLVDGRDLTAGLERKPTLAFLWLLVAFGGAAVGSAGGLSGWLEFALGVALALVGLSPFRRRSAAAVTVGTAFVATPLPNGDSPDPGPDSSAELSELASTQPDPSTRLSIRAIGALRLLVDGRDLTAGLERKPTLAFLFDFLVSRLVLDEPETKRDDLADELWPRIPQAHQRERLRKQVYKLQHTTPPEIGALVRANQTHLWLDLDRVDSDFGELKDLSERVSQGGPLIESALADEVRKMLTRTEGDLLAGFEVLEQKINQGDGSAGLTVRAAREVIWRRRAELVIALAEYEDTMGRPDTAIAPLKAALVALPERQDLARLLSIAYLKTGQTVRAAEVRRQYALKQD